MLSHTRPKHMLQDEGEEEIGGTAFWVAFLPSSNEWTSTRRLCIYNLIEGLGWGRQGSSLGSVLEKDTVGWATWEVRDPVSWSAGSRVSTWRRPSSWNGLAQPTQPAALYMWHQPGRASSWHIHSLLHVTRGRWMSINYHTCLSFLS